MSCCRVSFCPINSTKRQISAGLGAKATEISVAFLTFLVIVQNRELLSFDDKRLLDCKHGLSLFFVALAKVWAFFIFLRRSV